MPTIYLNIGSNNGDRHALIEQAVAAVTSAFPGAEIRRSEYIETEPWGFRSENKFLNIGVAIDIPESKDRSIHEMAPIWHRAVKEAERKIDQSLHRDADGNYIDRKIDIDIIAIDDAVIETPDLTVPHPRMHQRDFVLRPMAELAPEWRHPLLHLTVTELLESVK